MSGLICGIDPGVLGAVGFLTERGEYVSVFDMPVYETTTGRRQIDPVELASILMQQRPLRCVLERVNARPGEGAVGAFSFGHSLGVIQGVLGALGFPYELVQPAVWKRKAGIPPGAGKGASIATAKQQIPSAAAALTLVKHDGRAEALLLARHGLIK